MKRFFKKLFRIDNTQMTPLESLASLISGGSPEVMREVQNFERSPQAYFDALDENLKEDCSIESPSDISNTDVLIRALHESNFLAVADNSEEPLSVLEKLNRRAKNKLEKSTHYEVLKKFYSQTEWGFGSLVGGPGSIAHNPDIFACAKDVQLAVLAINDDSDALILFVCASSQRDGISSLSQQASIKLFFENM